MGKLNPTPIDLLATALLCILVMSGALAPLETRLLDWRFQVLDRAPSDSLVIVEIDPASLREEERWPWSRALYARAVHNLKEAGASVIAFDVDFSSRGDEKGDALFRDALDAYPGEILLPEFHQARTLLSAEGGVERTAPHPYFLKSAAIATANLFLEKNGVGRRGWCGAAMNNGFRGSLAGVLANRAAPCDTFLIDYSIAPAKLARLSFVDVEQGRFDPVAVAGKHVLIGATALELGDEFATPVYGLLPGVALHALSYESLVQGRTIEKINDAVAISLAAIVFFFLVRAGASWSWRTLSVHALTASLAIIVPFAVQALFPLSLSMAPVLAAQVLAVSWMTVREMKERARALLSQRLETLKQQALIASVVRESSDGIIITDRFGRIEVSNDRAKVLLGLPEDGLAGALSEIAPDFPTMHIDAESGAEEIAEHFVRSGSDRILEIAGSCVSPGGNRTYFTYSLRDVTARKALEKAEREAKDAALAAATFKTQLISNMSHELRTPLNAIVGFADVILRQEPRAEAAPEYTKYAKFIQNSGGRLLGLVTDILFVSQADAGEVTLNRDTYSLRELWDECLEGFEERLAAEKKEVSVRIAANFPALNLDSEVFSRALRHLVSNAVKFTTEGGAIAMHADYSPSAGAQIVIEDDGPGVAAEHLPRLSQAFFQADASLRRGYEGSGLGLYVAQKCASLHGGSLRLESELGKGFRAIITLPPSAASDSRAAA